MKEADIKLKVGEISKIDFPEIYIRLLRYSLMPRTFPSQPLHISELENTRWNCESAEFII